MYYVLRLKNEIKIILSLSLISLGLGLFQVGIAYAQTIDPASWQNNAAGLKTTSNPDKKTAGLMVYIKPLFQSPFISLPGGIKDYGWSKIGGPIGIDLGEVKAPETTPSLTSESADWAHDEMTFSNNLKLWVSRLSPAILIQNLNSSLRLFSGNLNGAYWGTPPWGGTTPYIYNRTAAPAYPKYVAYQAGGTVHVAQIPASGDSALNFPALDNNWILVWYGNNSHFLDTNVPLSYSDGQLVGSVPHSDAYTADAPILFKFENNPTGIKQTSEGGIDLTFATNSGYTSMFPLFGREHPKASDTEGWGSAEILPANVISKINFWNTNNRLCSYPTTVTETYSYDTVNDTSTFTENITYLPVCLGGSTTSGFAILPPMLSIVRSVPNLSGQTNPLGINVSGVTTDAFYPTEFGPLIGINNTNTYTWSISGLKKYTDSSRVLSNGAVPAELIQELAKEIDKTVASSHYKPWIVSDHVPRSNTRGDIYFLNPADTISALSELVPIAPESQKTNLINYIKSERTNYPPETVYNLPNSGTLRTPFSLDNYNNWQQQRQDIFLKRTPLYSYHALSQYYSLPGTETIPDSVMAGAKTALNYSMSEQDWATMFWFKGFSESRPAVISANRNLAGLIGFIKLAKSKADSQEGLARSLFAKAVVSRVALAKYPSYIYSAGLTKLPNGADWLARYTQSSWYGLIWNYNWGDASGDLRQVAVLDQFGSLLYDSSGFWDPINWSQSQGWNSDWIYTVSSYLIGYRDTTPEVFRLLGDYAKAESLIYADRYTTLLPHWYIPFTEAILGAEHNINHPVDAFQIFMAKALLQGESAQNLKKYRSIPYLSNGGDFFYMQKLAETIKAYQGVAWEDELTGSSLTGDVNNDTQVNVLDIQACANHILGIQDLGSRGDVNGDGSVNVLDVQNIVNIILGV